MMRARPLLMKSSSRTGILVGYMNSRETAQHFGMEPHGNARGYAYSDEPPIRMRNTAILPGKDKLEDMTPPLMTGTTLPRPITAEPIPPASSCLVL